jgi:hypothetical protein
MCQCSGPQRSKLLGSSSHMSQAGPISFESYFFSLTWNIILSWVHMCKKATFRIHPHCLFEQTKVPSNQNWLSRSDSVSGSSKGAFGQAKDGFHFYQLGRGSSIRNSLCTLPSGRVLYPAKPSWVKRNWLVLAFLPLPTVEWLTHLFIRESNSFVLNHRARTTTGNARTDR